MDLWSIYLRLGRLDEAKQKSGFQNPFKFFKNKMIPNASRMLLQYGSVAQAERKIKDARDCYFQSLQLSCILES